MTVSDFVDYYQSKFPCPNAPSSAFLLEDTLAGHKDKQGLIVPAHGRMLRVETKYFQIIEHEKRMTPEMIVAYGLETPNLLRGGYTFSEPDHWKDQKNMNQYTSTTGNAVFWSPTEALVNANGEPYYHSNKPDDAFNRCYTFYVGDDWMPYQFTDSQISNVKRNGNKISWTKEMKSAIAGTDIRVRYDNVVDDKKHKIRVSILGKDAVGQPVHMRISPYFHQGWDNDYIKAKDRDPKIPDPSKVGQEQNVYAKVNNEEFAYSESNLIQHYKIIVPDNRPAALSIFNRNPGVDPSAPGWTIDDNPDMNRGFTVTFQADRASVEMIDPPGAANFVTSIINLGNHSFNREYDFEFEYWHGIR